MQIIKDTGTHLQPTPTAPQIPVTSYFEVPPMSGKYQFTEIFTF